MTDKEKEVRLAEIRKSISEMTDDELAERLNITRNNRRPKPKAVRSKSAKPKASKKAAVPTDLANLTPEQAKALLAKLIPSNDDGDNPS